MIYLTRRETFNAAHRLFRKDFSDEENLKVFGKCSNPNWHGHNYVLYVTVKGELNTETSFVMNLKKLSEIIKTYIIEHIDHKNINTEVGFMNDLLASTENLTIAIWEELKEPIAKNGVMLHCVKVEETENNYVEYYG